MKKFAFAALVISAGILLLLINTGLVSPEYKGIFFSWKTLIFGIGFVNLFSRESLPTGIILTTIGASLIFTDYLPIAIKLHEILIPLVLILIGITVLFHKRKSKCRFSASDTNPDESILEEINIFSGSKRMFTSKLFRGGSIVNVFGGTEIDFRNCELPDQTVQLDLICVFGGANFIVPEDWTVKFESVAVLGGFSDKRNKLVETDSKKVLLIKGVCVLGGGEIKNCETCNM